MLTPYISVILLALSDLLRTERSFLPLRARSPRLSRLEPSCFPFAVIPRLLCVSGR